ncbi:tetratricopeptide repeat-containing sensor histidine kinase [Flavobacterium caeni]|uniref:Tetratricopeptide repeat-containing protein n=1 Tax=Flavobacterium caeni TaxID=490189 RepID=A0A1G5GWD5_9FLAO|nr:tetratricopeptide repeat protein [Flavobacterium caeni]SCY55912.1 Tetratricopeptide repeat-containing protein [Flavobacterium caeni]
MFQKIALVAIFFVTPSVFAQQPMDKMIDSLRTDLSQHTKQDTVRAENMIALGDLLQRTDAKQALAITQQATDLSRKLQWERGVFSCLRQLGTIYAALGIYDKAIEKHLQSMTSLEKVKADPKKKILGKATVYNNLAICYTRMRMFDKSIAANKKAIALFQQMGDDRMLAGGYINLSSAYMDSGDLKLAESTIDESYRLAQKTEYIIAYLYYFSNKGNIRNQQKKYPEAIAFYKQGLDLAQKLGAADMVAEITIALGECYYYSGQYAQAREHLESGLETAKAIDLGSLKYQTLGILAETYNHLKIYDRAYTTYKDFAQLRDSIIGSEKKEEIARKEVQFEADKKQAAAEAEIERQKVIRYGTIGGSAVLLLSGFLLFTGYRRRQSSEHRAAVANLRTRVLRLQMNPHFIFNSLNSISDYIGKNDIKSADYYLAKFSKLMRGTLENSEETTIPLADELKMLDLYMQLEAVRLNQKFTFEFKVDPDIDPETTLVPPLILQPFVENSIWHGMTDNQGPGKITIEATRRNDMLQCVVEDNGSGRKNTAKKDGKSYGVKITKDRIELLNKMQNTNASVHLVDLDKGTRVEVLLPLNESEV